MQFGLGVIGIVAILQSLAWICGFNGQVFAFTSLVIGGISGTILGFSFGKIEDLKKEIEEE